MSDVRPTLTVAAIVERDGRFLCVEERIDGVLRQIRSLLYEQGYTIGGARLRLEGEGAKQESALSNQIAKQVRMELEEVVQLRRR